MRSPTKLHIVTGKGGVGKSTFAAALTQSLTEENLGPVLLIEIQGSGRSLEILGMENHSSYDIQPLPNMNQAWGCRILPRPAFRQYFTQLLAMGQHDSTFAQLTSGLRTRFVDSILENKVVSAFVDVCPGLEPASLLGKVHWECTEGTVPEHENLPWKHVVVDAPSTGHAVMLFKSTQALMSVFGSGVVFKQAGEIMKLMTHAEQTRLYILSTPEELPLKEAADLSQTLLSLKLPRAHFVLNRQKPTTAQNFISEEQKQSLQSISPQWVRELQIEVERSEDEKILLQTFLKEVGREKFDCVLPELVYSAENHKELARLCRKELNLS